MGINFKVCSELGNLSAATGRKGPPPQINRTA